MDELDGDGGKCEKSDPCTCAVECTRRECKLSPWLDEDELAEVCLACLTFTDNVSRLRSFVFSRVAAVDTRALAEGMPTPSERCLRTPALSFSFPCGLEEGRCFETSAPELSISNSSEVRFLGRWMGDTKEEGGDPALVGESKDAIASAAAASWLSESSGGIS